MSNVDRDAEGYSRSPFDPVLVDEMDHYDVAEDDDQRTGRGWLMLVAIFAVAAALAGVIFFAYQQGREEGIRAAPPVLRADQSPEKAAPEDPGGMEIPHQDKQIFDRITDDTGADAAQNPVERLLPPPEEPIKRPVAPAPAPAATGAAPAASTPATPQSIPTVSEPAASEPAASEPAASDTAAPESVASGPIASEPAPDPQTVPAEAAATPDAAADKTTDETGRIEVATLPAPAPAAEQAPAPDPAAAGAGEWLVQVGAFRDAQAARAEWGKIAGKHPDILATRTADIQSVDLAERGIWYRLRASAFATQDEARAACARLKAAGTDCLVRQR